MAHRCDIFNNRKLLEAYWHSIILSDRERDDLERERFTSRIAAEVDEVGSLLHQLSLLSSDTEDNDVMDAHEFINYEVDFDLNNPYEPTEENILDVMLPSEDLEIVADEVIDDAVEDLLGLDVVEGYLHGVKKFLQQRPRDVLSCIKMVETILQEVAVARMEDSHQSALDSFFERV